MLEDDWRIDWTAFVEYVARAIERGETSKSLSATMASQRVHWKGRVAQARLGTDYASGIALTMEHVRSLLSNGFTLVGRHLFLRVHDEDQKRRMRNLKAGDLVEFYSTIGNSNQAFDPLELSFHDAEKTNDLHANLHARRRACVRMTCYVREVSLRRRRRHQYHPLASSQGR